jgi:hypothetical protein
MPHAFSFEVQPPQLRLRSQHGLALLHNERVFSLEDVVEAKHSMRMLLADRVKDDLVAAEPATTPRGLASPEQAAAFAWAVEEKRRQFGSWDVAWGEVHRVRRGSVDAPVGGCSGTLGCFRVLNFSTATDGRRVVDGGDGWVLAVEFGNEPRAYSVLAYGQSPDPQSPYHADQAGRTRRRGTGARTAATLKRVRGTRCSHPHGIPRARVPW